MIQYTRGDNSIVYQVAAPTGTSATDTANVQAACDAAYADGGGLVQLQPGTYVVKGDGTAAHGAIQVKDYVTLAGAGIGVTTLKVENSTLADITGIIRTISGVQNTHVTFRDMTVDGNEANNTVNITGFYCGVTPNSTQTDTDISVINVEVKNCSNYGFDPHERTTRLRMINCIATNCGTDGAHDGFTLDAQYDGELIGCISYSNGRHGFNFTTASNNMTLIGCEAYSNSGDGYALQNGSKNINLVGCKGHDNTLDGIYVNGVAQVGQQDNTPGVNNSIKACEISLSGGHGIHLVGSSYNHIAGNTVRDSSQTTNNTSNQIYLDETGTSYSTNNTITDNDLGVTSGVANAPKYGIYEKTSNEDFNFILGNRSVGAVTAQLNLAGGTSIALSAHNGVNEHPSENPSAHGYKEWNYDPISAGSGSGQVATGGTLYTMLLTARNAATISNVVLTVGTAGATLTTGQNLVGIYDGTTGAQLGVTGDQSTAWTTTGVKSMALTSSFSVTAGQKLLVMVMSNGTTPPAFVRSGATGVSTPNAGLSATAPARFTVAGTAQTALPASLTLASLTASGAQTYWTAVS